MRSSLDGSSKVYGQTFNYLGYITLTNTVISALLSCGLALRQNAKSDGGETQTLLVPSG